VLFDVDAIKAEIENLEGGDGEEEIQIKQLESTLPPMKLDLSAFSAESSNLQVSKTRKSDAGLPARPSLNQASPWLTSDQTAQSGRSMSLSTAELTAKASEKNRFSGNAFSAIPEYSNERPASALENNGRAFTPLHNSYTTPIPPIDHNVWDDEEDFGQEKEITMTFE
jgi:hypothetical protein